MCSLLLPKIIQMNIFNKIPRNLKQSFLRFKNGDIFTKIFILIGARFYFDWILPTNPQSKNPVWWFFWRDRHIFISVKINLLYKIRLGFCFIYTAVHFVEYYKQFQNGFGFNISNILLNIYPIIVQIYIGIRCCKIIRSNILKKKSRNYLLIQEG